MCHRCSSKAQWIIDKRWRTHSSDHDNDDVMDFQRFAKYSNDVDVDDDDDDDFLNLLLGILSLSLKVKDSNLCFDSPSELPNILGI